MGLKSPSLATARRTILHVAIEPLWDWNYHFCYLVLDIFYSCNRTIMGLKSRMAGASLPPIPCCNRTIMGLKSEILKVIEFVFAGLQSNHYGIEMKISVEYRPWEGAVAIEPLWDWNLVFIVKKISHHVSCNRTIMGLKSCFNAWCFSNK